jgi:hypothetical protein
MPDDVVAHIVRERAEGKTTYAIARDLSKDAVPTAQSARVWSQATVRALLTRKGRAHKGQAPAIDQDDAMASDEPRQRSGV